MMFRGIFGQIFTKVLEAEGLEEGVVWLEVKWGGCGVANAIEMHLKIATKLC